MPPRILVRVKKNPKQFVFVTDRMIPLLHVSLNRPRFKDEDMQQVKVLQRPLSI